MPFMMLIFSVLCCLLRFVVVKLLVFRCLAVVIPGFPRVFTGWPDGTGGIDLLVSDGVLRIAGDVGADVGDDGVYEAATGCDGGPCDVGCDMAVAGSDEGGA